MNKIAIDITGAITPPSLFGIDRRIAYANRKYQSGWMYTGVTRGFAVVKLSGSLKMYVHFIIVVVKNEWNNTSTTLICLHGLDWDTLTFVRFVPL